MKKIKELSGTGGGGGFSSGMGGQYTTKYAFRLKKKNLKENENPIQFQEKRIKDFDKIFQELSQITSELRQARAETIEYYKNNPTTFKVIKPTDLILDYLNDIKKLLKS